MNNERPLLGLSALGELIEVYDGCNQCPALCASRQVVVHASGSASAPILIVGEAPGADEDEQGVPFVGKAGQLFMEMLKSAWPESEELERIEEMWDERAGDNSSYWETLRDFFDDHILWTNVVQCRPEDNRTPIPSEIKACRDRLIRTIYAVDPRIIIAAGKTAASALMGKVVQITKDRGTIYDISIPSPATGEMVRYPMLAILHPAYLLRKGDQGLVSKERGETYATIQDLKWALELLNQQYQLEYGTSFPER